MSLREYLTTEIKSWEFIGAPALLQRFVLRNGKAYTPTKRIGRRGTPKECYANATKLVLRTPVGDGWSYVEGYALHRTNPILAFHHAWVTTTGKDAMDPTLNAAEYEYFGVVFDKKTLVDWLRRYEVYGLLDTGMYLNTELIFGKDPELEDIVEGIRPHPKYLTHARTLLACLLAALVLLPHDLRAEQATVYGPDGRVQQRVLTSPNGSSTVYGADGRVQGRTTTSPTSGVTTVYGSDGRVTGTIAPSGGRK